MALVIDLKPSEKIIIGNALVTNDDARARLHIEGDAPILREKDILLEKDVNTPCKRIYFAIQLMYLSPEPHKLHETYFALVKEIQEAAPSTSIFFMKINDFIMEGQLYKAMKEAKVLIEHEKELTAHV